MFTLSSSSLISDGDGGSHMETVRVITHTIGRGVQKIQAVKSAKCSMLYQPLDHCSWNSNITQGTQSLCLDWTPSPLSPSPQCHYVNTPMLTFFRPLTPIPLSFVSCLIFGICGNVGNQTKVAAAAAEGGSGSAGTKRKGDSLLSYDVRPRWHRLGDEDYDFCTGWPISSMKTSCWPRFEMFRHPT